MDFLLRLHVYLSATYKLCERVAKLGFVNWVFSRNRLSRGIYIHVYFSNWKYTQVQSMHLFLPWIVLSVEHVIQDLDLLHQAHEVLSRVGAWVAPCMGST
jgi:hypothetical protein